MTNRPVRPETLNHSCRDRRGSTKPQLWHRVCRHTGNSGTLISNQLNAAIRIPREMVIAVWLPHRGQLATSHWLAMTSSDMWLTPSAEWSFRRVVGPDRAASAYP
jgi:hypothetical protein